MYFNLTVQGRIKQVEAVRAIAKTIWNLNPNDLDAHALCSFAKNGRVDFEATRRAVEVLINSVNHAIYNPDQTT